MCIRNTNFKIVERNEAKFLMLAINFEKDCSIGVSERSIRVYPSFITTLIL